MENDQGGTREAEGAGVPPLGSTKEGDTDVVKSESGGVVAGEGVCSDDTLLKAER